MTLPEVLVWQELRRRPAGYKFRRQHPAGPYVLDFFCAEARLAIEIDGEAHECGDAPDRDGVRDAWLGAQGLQVSRIPARDVLGNLDNVIQHIIVLCRNTPPPPLCGGPLPLHGRIEEDL